MCISSCDVYTDIDILGCIVKAQNLNIIWWYLNVLWYVWIYRYLLRDLEITSLQLAWDVYTYIDIWECIVKEQTQNICNDFWKFCVQASSDVIWVNLQWKHKGKVIMRRSWHEKKMKALGCSRERDRDRVRMPDRLTWGQAVTRQAQVWYTENKW